MDGSAAEKTYALIANPRAGNNRGAAIARCAADVLGAAGHRVVLRMTEAAGHATTLARELARDVDGFVAVGGDGTLAEILAGCRDTRGVVLGIIPAGTANVVAREFGVPLGDPAAAAAVVVEGKAIDVDYGLILSGSPDDGSSRPFLANAGGGFDAMVVQAVAESRRRGSPRMGMLRYVPLGVAALFRYRAPQIRLVVDGEPWDGSFSSVVVCNLANYGGVLSICPDASPRDGLLDLCARRGRGRLSLLRHLAAGLLRWKDDGQQVERARAGTIRLQPSEATAIQVDGDYYGVGEVEIRVSPERVRLLVPTGGKWS